MEPIKKPRDNAWLFTLSQDVILKSNLSAIENGKKDYYTVTMLLELARDWGRTSEEVSGWRV